MASLEIGMSAGDGMTGTFAQAANAMAVAPANPIALQALQERLNPMGNNPLGNVIRSTLKTQF